MPPRYRTLILSFIIAATQFPSAAARAFTVSNVDTTGNTGWYTSLKLRSDGAPVIAYWGQGDGDLRVARWSIFTWTIETASTNGGRAASLALDGSNNPRVAHIGSSSLRYSVKSAGAWTTTTVDPNADVGSHCPLVLDANDNPHIAYAHDPEVSLRYASHIVTWGFETVDTVGAVGGEIALALDSLDEPHIAYYDYLNNALRYAHKHNGAWSRQTIDGYAGPSGTSISIAVNAAGFPRIAYVHGEYGTMNLATKSLFGGWTIESIGGPGVNGEVSLALDTYGQPHILCGNPILQELTYTWRADGVWSWDVVAHHNGPWFPSLALRDGTEPRVAYCHYIPGDLKYASMAVTGVPGDPTAAGAAPALSVRPSVLTGGTVSIVCDLGAGAGSVGGASAPLLELFDVTGRRVRSLSGGAATGEGTQAWSLVWDGRDAGGAAVAPGVYLLRLSTGDGQTATRKLTVVR